MLATSVTRSSLRPSRRPLALYACALLAVLACGAIYMHTRYRMHPEARRMVASNCNLAAKQLQIQLQAFVLDNGRAPTSLLELVPGYFEHVPKDAWGDDFVWSVSTDGAVRVSSPRLEALRAAWAAQTAAVAHAPVHRL